MADQINDKLDAIVHHMNSIDVTLARQQVSLDDHVQRTHLLQDQVQTLQSNQDEFKGAVKFIKLIGILAGIAEAISQVFRHF